jgi:hypothetical protein
VVWHDVAAVREGFSTDSAFHVLLGDLSSEQFLHFRRRPDFTISPWMMRIFDALNTRELSGPLPMFASTTEKRLVNRTAFFLAEFH